MEEMVGAWNDHDRQFLRPRPFEDFCEWDGFVHLAMNDDRVGRHGFRGKAADRDAHEHHAMRARAPRNLRLDRSPERESRQNERQRAKAFPGVLGDAEQVFGLSAAFVVLAFRFADAAEIGPQRNVTQLDEGFRESLHDLVVERPAVERVRVSDERDAPLHGSGTIYDRLDPARASVDEDALERPAHMSRRSTTRPPWRCSSMISSISARST